MGTSQWVMLLLVFGAVVALALGLWTTVGAAAGERLRMRLLSLRDEDQRDETGSVIRARYLRQLPPWERWLEQRPGMAALGRLGERAGRPVRGYRIAMLSVALALAAGVVVLILAKSLLVAAPAALAGLFAPLLKLRLEYARRLATFEEQLPDALDLMARSLRAGNPLMESFKFVGDEMHPPVSTEFLNAWNYINYGVSMKAALLHMLELTPSVSLRAMVTAILVQRETGGNLAEVLDKITGVLRARAKFQRRLKTLTAEGRMSASILVAIPFVLAGVLSVSSPTYLPLLLKDPLGGKLILVAASMMAVGVFWVSRIVRIRV